MPTYPHKTYEHFLPTQANRSGVNGKENIYILIVFSRPLIYNIFHNTILYSFMRAL